MLRTNRSLQKGRADARRSFFGAKQVVFNNFGAVEFDACRAVPDNPGEASSDGDDEASEKNEESDDNGTQNDQSNATTMDSLRTSCRTEANDAAFGALTIHTLVGLFQFRVIGCGCGTD